MASLTLITPSTAYPWLGVALFIVGVGLGLAFTVASDVILASVPKERAGAAAAVSETAYELGMALGIATLGSIVIGVYRGFPVPPACRQRAASAAHDSLAAAIETAGTLPANQADGLLTAAQERVHHRSGHRLGRRLGTPAGRRGRGVAAAQAAAAGARSGDQRPDTR